MSAAVNKEIQLEIAHVLFIDIVGYSKLLITEQSELLRRLSDVVRETEQFRSAEAQGKLVRLPTGDGMALVFRNNPEAPVKCALELSKKLKAHPELSVRMGIHSGPVNEVADVNERTNITGAGINVGQRVMDCGDAGHILLSRHVADDLSEYRHWQAYLHDLGESAVKHGLRLHVFNLHKDGLGNPQIPEKLKRRRRWRQEAVAVRPLSARSWTKYVLTAVLLASTIALVISSSFLFHRATLPKITSAPPGATASNVAAPIPEKSIAVLPFENLSAEKENAYFADGVQDEVLTNLDKVADLKVISRTSVIQYRNAATRNLREIAQQLGVAHVLEGSVQRAGGRVRVSAQLIDARTDMHLWAERYDRDLADVFAIQSEIAKTIADQLQAKISPSEKAAIEKAPTTDLAAFDLYERAKALWADVMNPLHAREH